MPAGGHPVRDCSIDGDPLARTVAPDRGFHASVAGWRQHSHRIKAHAAFILGLWEERRDVTLVEMQRRLAERGTPVGIGTVHRFFKRHGLTRKKRPATRSNRTATMS